MSDTITFACPNCSTPLDVPAELAGVSGPCPRCGVTITAPMASRTAVPEYLPQDTLPSFGTVHAAASPQASADAMPSGDDYENEFRRSKSVSSSAKMRAIRRRAAIRNGVVGFLTVVVLASVTWGISLSVKKYKQEKAAEDKAFHERSEPKPAPIKIDSSALKESSITDDGRVKEANTVFPLVNTVEPSGANSNASSTPDDVIEKNQAELAALLEDAPSSSESSTPRMGESEKMVVVAEKLIHDFFAAESLQERLPLIFSERVPAGEMAEQFANTILDKPIKLDESIGYSSVVFLGHEGPNGDGIIQQYYTVTLANRPDGSKMPMSIILHMANHHNKEYRINADAFLFSAQNELEQFLGDPQAEPLIAYLFLERTHYKAGADDSPSGVFSVRLLTSPSIPSNQTALVDTMRATGEVLNRVVQWGVAPRAAVVELKHERDQVSGERSVVIDRLLKLNWLQSYKETSGGD